MVIVWNLLFYNGDVIFVKKTKAIHHGQIIVVIVNNEAYVKKPTENKEIDSSH